jgi:hypothetical protein
MSRIIITRHGNDEEALSAGYDRPMGYFFVDRYDEHGEYVGGIGLLGSGPCPSPAHAASYLRDQGVPVEVAEKVQRLLREHEGLEYPESNVTIDLTKEES